MIDGLLCELAVLEVTFHDVGPTNVDLPHSVERVRVPDRYLHVEEGLSTGAKAGKARSDSGHDGGGLG